MMIEFIEFLKDMFKYFVIIGIIVLIRIFVLSTTGVVGTSMNPTLIEEEILLVETVTPKLNKHKRFEVAIIKYTRPKTIIKRIIGLPGEKVTYKDNILYINDVKTEESFTKAGTVKDLEVTLKEDEFFVVGDNRDDSTDSRSFGAIKKSNITGKAILRIWPLNKIRIIK